MRHKTEVLAKLVNDYLVSCDTGRASAKKLSEKFKVSVSRIYMIIRVLREKGTGVLPSRKGYILSEFATKKDDVHFFRMISGRRVSDYMAVTAAAPDIRKRWNTVEDRNTFKLIVAPATGPDNGKMFKAGLTALMKMKS